MRRRGLKTKGEGNKTPLVGPKPGKAQGMRGLRLSELITQGKAGLWRNMSLEKQGRGQELVLLGEEEPPRARARSVGTTSLIGSSVRGGESPHRETCGLGSTQGSHCPALEALACCGLWKGAGWRR